jgi:hypothetical protein
MPNAQSLWVDGFGDLSRCVIKTICTNKVVRRSRQAPSTTQSAHNLTRRSRV